MKVEDKVIELIEKFEVLAAKLGPEVTEVTLQAVQWGSIINLIALVGALLISVVGIYYCMKIFKITEIGDVVVRSGSVGILLLLVFIIVLICLADPYTWIAIFKPEAAIAYKIISGM